MAAQCLTLFFWRVQVDGLLLRQAQQSPQPQGMAHQAVNHISPQLQTREQDILEKSHRPSFALEPVEAWSFPFKTLVPGTATEAPCLCPASTLTGTHASAGLGIWLPSGGSQEKVAQG